MLMQFDFENLPIVDVVNQLIADSVKRNASDIHFEQSATDLKVRIRIDGSLIDYATVPDFIKKNLITRIKIIAGMDIMESRLPQDGAIKREVDGDTWDLRVSTLPTVDGEKVVIRILDYSMSMAGLENLGFTEQNLALVNKMIASPSGIILTTGATGTGKSTTVYAMLQKLNRTETNVVTVEDPVEMKITGINQLQVMSDIGLDFGTALRSILRQDPDIIMIGEIRDDETARIAVRASITGHLVLSTIHTNNSLNTIERLLDMDVERYLLGSALTGIVSQRLTKKLCPHCKKERPTTEYEKNVFKKTVNKDITKIYEPVGCAECLNGYRGRIAIHEVLPINQELRDAIVTNTRKDNLRKLVYGNENVLSLLQDGLIKVERGDTTFEEILRVIDIDEDLGEEDTVLKNALIGRNTPNDNKNKVEEEKKEPEVKSEEKTETVPVPEPNENKPEIKVVPLETNQAEPSPNIFTKLPDAPKVELIIKEANPSTIDSSLNPFTPLEHSNINEPKLSEPVEVTTKEEPPKRGFASLFKRPATEPKENSTLEKVELTNQKDAENKYEPLKF